MSSYYFAKKREAEPTARETRDAIMKDKIMEVWKGEKGREVYGARKVWLELNRQGIPVARCTVERLMGDLGIGGARAGGSGRAPRCPAIPRTGRLTCWSAASTRRAEPALGRGHHVCVTFSGWVYTSFVMDLFARRVLGWQVADHLRSDLALDALEMAIWARRNETIDGLVHHSDRGVQYTSIRYTERLEEAEAVRSVGSKGDSYDNAAAESLNSLYKRELIDFGNWQGLMM